MLLNGTYYNYIQNTPKVNNLKSVWRQRPRTWLSIAQASGLYKLITK